MAGEIIQHHQVAWPQGRGQEVLAESGEAETVEWPVEDHRGASAIERHGMYECGGLPVPAGNLLHQTRAALGPTSQPRQVGFDPRLVHEDEPLGIHFGLTRTPVGALLGDVWAILLSGPRRLFL